MAVKSDLNWQNLSIETLSPTAAKAFAGYKEAYKLATERRKAFEATMIADAKLPSTHTLVFGYRFGKLSVAVTEATELKTPQKSGGLSLADYLKTVSTR